MRWDSTSVPKQGRSCTKHLARDSRRHRRCRQLLLRDATEEKPGKVYISKTKKERKAKLIRVYTRCLLPDLAKRLLHPEISCRLARRFPYRRFNSAQFSLSLIHI